ncbi:MAG: PorP/SprF family type IX secretion system membrane protein [Chitinophagales bacterium]
MRKLLTILFLLGFLSTKAQDAHVTQKFNNIPFVNPALTGNGDKLNRVTFLYRDQWRSVIVPYSSTYIGYDRQLLESNNNLVSGGVHMFYDKAGDGSLSTYNPSASVSYTRFFNGKKYSVSGGLRLGYLQTAFDFNAFQFGSQYGVDSYDPNLGSGEALEKASFVNLGIGVNTKITLYGKSSINVGFAVDNPHQPYYSFSSFTGDPRPIKYSTQFTGELFVANQFSLTPNFYFQAQEKATEYHSSLLLNYYTKSTKTPVKLTAGAGYRGKDAALTYVGAKIKDLQVGFSVDINTSDFTEATNKKGGFEVSLIYEFERRRNKIVEIDTVQNEEPLIVEADTVIEEITEDTVAEITEVEVIETPETVTEVEEPEPVDVPVVTEVVTPKEIDLIKSILPLPLFFDNDQPKSSSQGTQSYTTSNYLSTFDQYLSRKNEYSSKIGTKKTDEIFNKLTQSRNQLDQVVDYLKTLTENGYKVRLTFKGYASPLGSSEYNTLLSMRRIESVILYLNQANDGVLQPYIENGTITILRNPFGEDNSTLEVDDKATNAKQSIYSPSAAFERRVEIIEVEIIK